MRRNIIKMVALMNIMMLPLGAKQVKFSAPASTIKVSGKSKVKQRTKIVVSKGTLSKSANALLEGSIYEFDNGTYVEDNGSNVTLSGVLNPPANTLSIQNQKIVSNGGVLRQSVSASGANCKLEGLTTDVSRHTITLANSSSVLNYGIVSNQPSEIVLNGGTVKLFNDLKFSGTAKFICDGTVIFNGRALYYDATPRTFDNVLLLQNAADLEFNGKMTLTGEWIFTGSGFVSGNGNILDMSQGGTIRIKANTPLYLSNLKLKGLGSGHIVFDAPTSQLLLSFVEIEMDNNYSVTMGGIYAEGPTKIVTKDHYLIFDQEGSMTVDGIGLLYSTLTFTANDNVRPTPVNDPNQKFIAYLNDGVIKAEGSGSGDGELTRQNSNAIVYLDREVQTIDHGPMDIVITTTSHYLEFDIFLSNDHIMDIQSSTVIDGKGHTIHLAKDSDGIIQMLDSLNVTFKNVIFRNYRDEIFLFGTDDTLIFGDGVRLELAEHLSMQMPWICQGMVEVNGHDNRLTVNPYGEMVVLPGGLLKLQNVYLDGVQDNNLRCCDRFATMKLSQSNLELSDVFTFTSGALIIDQEVSINGVGAFNYESNTTSTINATSRLKLTNIEFRYAPSVARKTLLAFTDQTSELFLNGCTLATTTTGLQLFKGTLRVDNKNQLSNVGAQSLSQAVIFGDGVDGNDLILVFSPGGELRLADGIIDYKNVDSI